MSKIITVKNIKNEIYKINFNCDSEGKYTVLQLKQDLCNLLRDNLESTEYKIIFNGSVLKDDQNLNEEEILEKSVVFLKKPRKITINQTNSDNTVNQSTNNINVNVNLIAKSLINSAMGLLINNRNAVRYVLSTDPYVNQLSTNGITPETLLSEPHYNQILDELKNILGEIPNNPNGLRIELQNRFAPVVLNSNNLQTILSNFLNQQIGYQYTDNDNNEDEQNDDENNDNEDEHNDDSDDVENDIVSNEMTNLYNEFNEEERNQIQTLINMGYNSYEVLQMYVACNKNVDLTMQNLMLNN